MQKITCPKCGKQFIWTDESPPRGECPTPNCGWRYDVREEIGKGLAKRAGESAPPGDLLVPRVRSRPRVCLDPLQFMRHLDSGFASAEEAASAFYRRPDSGHTGTFLSLLILMAVLF